jgi:hypothetical protein
MIKSGDIPDIVISEMVFAIGGKLTKKQVRMIMSAGLNAWPEGAVVGKYDNDDTALLLPLLPHKEGES